MRTFIATATILSCFAIAAPAQIDRGYHEHARRVIDRVQDDLRRAEDFERHNGKEISRYENAQRHLSDFDRELTRGHFDKGRLENAIGDLKDVVDHNTLDPDARDALQRDLGDLRIMRDDHERH